MNWPDLIGELDAWRDEGRTASLWWRDDDAVAPTPALDRLAGLAGEHAVTVGLAVIPALAQPALAAWIGSAPVEVLPHGWQHRNHAGPGEKKAELAGHRQADAVVAELAQGLRRLGEIAGDRLRPVLVPPWNRIGRDLRPALPRLGFRGLSTFGPRPAVEPSPGLRQVNCHVDVVDWRGGRGFVGCDRALASVIAHLAARRARSVDSAEPTGLLTHHAVHEESTWTFLARFMERTRRHPAVRWLAPGEALLR
ncbi:MAG: polysaccharide deacetylase family protein [Thiotrichales bacterium]|nr:polysaccharide deacetylase family protein [Thiotrichales bacterium]